MDRITYRGLFLEANGEILNNITSLGISSDTQEEKLYELGVDDYNTPDVLPNADISVESREFGSLKNFLALSGLDPKKEFVRFKTDLDDAKTLIRVPVKVDDGIWTQICTDSVLTSYNLSYSVDGDSTEGYSLRADNRRIYASQKIVLNGVYEGAELILSNPSIIAGVDKDEVEAVYANRKLLTEGTDYEATVAEGKVTITAGTSEKLKAGDQIEVILKSTKKIELTKADRFSTRRGQVEVYLVKGIALANWQAATDNKGAGLLNKLDDANKLRIPKLQTLSLDIPLEREDLFELGQTKAYAKPVVNPLNITGNLDFIASDNRVLAWFMGQDDITTTTKFDIAKLVKDLGLIIKIYDKWDLDGERILNKIIEVPKFTISNENFNVGSDGGNATQSFSLSAEDACMYSPPVIEG